MKIIVTVKTNAKVNQVETLENGELRVSVKSPPQEGRANQAIIETLAEHFKIPKRAVEIAGGHKSKKKLILIRL